MESASRKVGVPGEIASQSPLDTYYALHIETTSAKAGGTETSECCFGMNLVGIWSPIPSPSIMLQTYW